MRIGITLAAALMFAAPALAGETKTYDLSGFDQISTSAGVSVEFVAGPKYSVVAEIITGDPERLRIEMDGSKLIVSHKMQTGFKRQPRLETRVRVTGPSLSSIGSSSGSTLSVSGLKATALNVSVSSGASLSVAGSCDTLTLSASSGASADLKDMACKSVTAKASSGASVDSTATQTADINASSGGSVDIWGNPAARKANKSMSGGSTTFH